jgi:hypothetical protein
MRPLAVESFGVAPRTEFTPCPLRQRPRGRRAAARSLTAYRREPHGGRLPPQRTGRAREALKKPGRLALQTPTHQYQRYRRMAPGVAGFERRCQRSREPGRALPAAATANNTATGSGSSRAAGKPFPFCCSRTDNAPEINCTPLRAQSRRHCPPFLRARVLVHDPRDSFISPLYSASAVASLQSPSALRILPAVPV